LSYFANRGSAFPLALSVNKMQMPSSPKCPFASFTLQADGLKKECTQRRWVLSRRACFWVSFGVSLHTLWTSAAPALSYRLYIDQWQLSAIETTGVFAVYPMLVVATLILFGGVCRTPLPDTTR
jgi:hypothetical protein